MATIYPLSAGNRYDASSVELRISGNRYIGITECDYEQTLEPGEVRGLHAQVLGFTRGIQKCSGRLVMLRDEFDDLTEQLATIVTSAGGGILEANFMLTVTYKEDAIVIGQITTDTLFNVRFTATKHRFQAGSSDALTVEMPFVYQYALVNGAAAIGNLLRGIIAANVP